MREKIVLAPGVNGNELLKSLAMHGVNCFGLRICNAGELARLALMRSGIPVTEEFLGLRDEVVMVAEAVREESYFGKTSYSDILKVTDTIRQIRNLVADGDEESAIEQTLKQGIFEEKNAALLAVYKKYRKSLSARKAVDAASLVRRAASESTAIDADFFVFEEYPISPLERSLIAKLSDGKYETVKAQEFCNVPVKKLKIESFKKCYGAPNEVETILADIYAGKKLDQCTVAVTDASTYGQLFFDYALLHDIPMTFGCGLPIVNSNPARLMVLYYAWLTDGYFGAASIEAMISSKAFDRSVFYDQLPEKEEGFHWNTFYGALKAIRFTNDAKVNEERMRDYKKAVSEEAILTKEQDVKGYKTVRRKELCIPYLEIMAKELALPPEEFITKYAHIRKGSATNAQSLLMHLDMAASKAIYDELRVIRTSGVVQNTEELILNVLRLSVGSMNSEAGKLHVTTINRAFTSTRENLYIAGLSASNFPGSPRENYLLLDADLRLFGDQAEYLTSDGRILHKREQLWSLVRFASGLDAKLYISYAGLNVSDLKKDNASSLVFELFREESGKNATTKELEARMEKVEYFEPAISTTRLVGEAYNQGKIITQEVHREEKNIKPVPLTLDREYSVSALQAFFGCYRNFMYSYILGLPQPQDYDPFSVINAADEGTMAHSLMEMLGNEPMTLDEFLKLSEETFDRFVAQHPPLIPSKVASAKDNFLEMMETAYHTETGREIALKEEDVHCEHETGVKIFGYPDRVEKLDDGTYLIVDFKSGRNISHVEDDVNTCMQILLYAYLMEQKGFKVSGGEYRYIRLGESVMCRYDDEMKEQVSDRLMDFKRMMESGTFPLDEAYGGSDDCKYCAYASICRKPVMGRSGDQDE